MSPLTKDFTVTSSFSYKNYFIAEIPKFFCRFRQIVISEQTLLNMDQYFMPMYQL